MRLGVNGWRIHGQRTGIGRYLTNVLKHWTAEVVNERFAKVNLYTPTAIERGEIILPDTIRERVLPPAWNMLTWENLRMAPVADDTVLFGPSYTRPLLARGRTVVSTHDVTWRMFPNLYPSSSQRLYDWLYTWSARRATLVITPTQTVRQDVARYLGVPLSRIRVVPLAADEVFHPRPHDARVAKVHARYLGNTLPFFFFVGKLSARRNVPRLLEAFAELKRRAPIPHRLLVIGLNTQGLNVARLATELGIARDVVHHEYISDDDLSLLYNASEAFIMPSTFETISLPVMEAQASGTPVITIDTPGMRETTGGEAILLPIAEVPEMVAAMERMVNDYALRRELSDRGLQHARHYSWQRCSMDTLAVLEEAARYPLPSKRCVNTPE